MGTDGYTISRATPAELDTVAPLFDAYRVFYGKRSDVAAARAFLDERLTNDESVVLLARDDASSSGLGFTQLYPSFSSVAARRLWILNDLFVAEHARRRGVARALMQGARELALQTGAIRLTLQTERRNTQAQALYESLGYVRQGGLMLEYALEL